MLDDRDWRIPGLQMSGGQSMLAEWVWLVPGLQLTEAQSSRAL